MICPAASILVAAFGILAARPDGAAAFARPGAGINIGVSPSTTSSSSPVVALSSRTSAFTSSTRARRTRSPFRNNNSHLFSSRVAFVDDVEEDRLLAFDPLGLCGDGHWDDASPVHRKECMIIDGTTTTTTVDGRSLNAVIAAPALALSSLSLNPVGAHAASSPPLSTGDFNPDSFRPICAASDSFYRLLQGSTRAVVGDENFSEYGPLIAGGLLRIRLELCVVESFFNEAVGPFVKENGLSWILPWHETVETFLAGTIFALATTFILVGSTKLIQIIAFYGDLIVGGPCRLFGGFFFDRARGEPVTLDVSFFGFFKTRLVGPEVDFKEEERRAKDASAEGGLQNLLDFDKVKPTDVPLLALSGGVKVVGDASKLFREFIEGLDLFVGRYLVLIASGYIIVKFIHFKVFPDFP